MKYVIALLILSAVAAAAGNTGTISGIVYNENGGAVYGAIIVVKGANLFAMSDADGYFVILGVPVGYYAVNASRIAYKTMIVENVRVIADTRTNVSFSIGGS